MRNISYLGALRMGCWMAASFGTIGISIFLSAVEIKLLCVWAVFTVPVTMAIGFGTIVWEIEQATDPDKY